jgi:Cu-processing system ATP-binding protein
MTSTVELTGITKRYGAIEAVRDVSFTLPAGEAVALVGHNGAGKTTLLKLMLGLIHPTAGTIRVLGENPAAGEFAARRGLGYLPESVSFNAALTGREILTFYARLKREPVEKSLELLDKVGLGAAAARRVGTYSKGMRQRLGLAQALIGAPKVLLLDEPTTGLDPALRMSFYQIVQKLRDEGTTVVLCSHALTEIEERTERVIIMNQGVMVAHGSIDELRRLASLPTRIRLNVSHGANGATATWLEPVRNWRQVSSRLIEIEATPQEKIGLLRRATDPDAPFDDVEVMPPTLDELYAHFLQLQADAR